MPETACKVNAKRTFWRQVLDHLFVVKFRIYRKKDYGIFKAIHYIFFGQVGCSTSEIVCGHNGETYQHECAALADRTTVDYYGECRVLGHHMGK